MGWTVFLLIAIVGMVIGVIFWGIGVYNRLIELQVRTENAWSQISVQLKRRWDLIPNLVNVVQGYAQHEKSTLEAVIAARNAAVSAEGVAQTAEAENMLTGMLRQVFALSEAYPELKANQNFMQLQQELTTTEDKISYSRQHYNDVIMEFNSTIAQVPTNIIANMFNFTKKDFFEVEEAETQTPVVSF